MRDDPSGWRTRVTEDMIADYTASGDWDNRTVAQAAWEKEAAIPDEVAVYTEDGTNITYGSIVEEARVLAAALQSLGLTQGDVISFSLPNWRETIAIDIAAAALGLVVNPIIPIYRDAELGFTLKDAGTKVLFIPEQFRSAEFPNMVDRLRGDLPKLEHVIVCRPESGGFETYDDLLDRGRAAPLSLPEVDPNNIKMILYTSGTTGRAKGVLHSHNTLPRAVHYTVDAWGMKPGDVMFMPSPVTHVTGYSYGIEMPFITDVKSAFMEVWNAEAAIDYINRTKSTHCVSATPFLQELITICGARGEGLPSLRAFGCGGAAVPPEIIYNAHRTFDNCRAFRVYGASEIPIISMGWQDPEHEQLAAETDGRIYKYDVRVVDDEDRDVAPGGEGEILARGATMMIGYADPAQTAEAFTEDGFFRSGDIGYVTPENAVVITGRMKDLIIRGGENLSAKEIEDVLHEHPAIREAAVVAVPNERLGEGVCACVILEEGAGELALPDVTDFVHQSGLAKQKRPERLEIMPDFPRTASGKIQKHVLRKTLAEG